MTFLPWTTIWCLFAFAFFSLFALLLAVLTGICFADGNDGAGIFLAVGTFAHGIIAHVNLTRMKHSYVLWMLEAQVVNLKEEELWLDEARRAYHDGDYETMYEALRKFEEFKAKRRD